jgi:leader peptidase (prepilin peptidase) / N-methyltransferase
MTLLFVCIIGAVLGSFINMLIYRLPLEESIVWKRSHCTTCNHTLNAIDLIPILSYVLQFSLCRYCKKHIPIRYLIVELLTVFTLGVSWGFLGHSFMFYKLVIFLLALIVIFFIDLDHFIIPDRLSLSLVVLGVFFAVLAEWLYFKQFTFILIKDSLLGGIIGFGIFFSLSVFAKWVFKKEALGFGDVKLIAGVGTFWGVKLTLMTAYFSFMFGGIIGILLIILKKRKRTDYIPFGPFIILAFVFSLLFQNYILAFFYL